ncbi:hypothetical protein [Streptomyces sp. H27-D2]|uniref:hypothetical protein n=1 Tax=Streptomyces sp. H27-D2 TaxID=3046304 RepID=UPI002DB693F7|nr:hypothetical protein [Streptomyces sp. H27-D2]MEC4020912.1 hypothetical protein [Streptomyces sp. H27-D2]
MDTESRRGAPRHGEPLDEALDHDIPDRFGHPLWSEEPVGRSRLPDPVRTAAVRAVIIVALTMIQSMVAVLCALAGAWFAFPAVLGAVAGTVVATWGVLDVWVTRQVWNQRDGVVSTPSSTARALRRRARRASARARPPGGRRPHPLSGV